MATKVLELLEVRNYKSLAELKLQFHKFNTIIGPNNSGKSNILDCLKLLFDSSRQHLLDAYKTRGGFSRIIFKEAEEPNVEIRVTVASGRQVASKRAHRYMYEAVLDSRGIRREELIERFPDGGEQALVRGSGGRGKYFDDSDKQLKEYHFNIYESALFQLRDLKRHKKIGVFRNEVARWRFFDFIPSESRRAIQPVRTYEVGSHGREASGVLHSILSEHREIFFEVEETLKAGVPEIKNLRSPLTDDGKTYIGVEESPFADHFDHHQISDGTIKLLASILVALLPTKELPMLACFEEPENYVHPRLIQMLADILKKMPTQVIATTHSPILVDFVDLDDLIVIEKEKGRTVLLDLPRTRITEFLKKFSLGELWYSGKLGGVP